MEGSQPNLQFYRGEIESEPDGDFIENILSKWKGDYKKLAYNCAYIQWLFPNRIAGKNPAASPLTPEEAELISQDPVLQDRVKRAFEMMLDFLGMELTEAPGQPCKFQLASNSTERLKYLNVWGNDSFLHISRILLSLKELGLADLMLPWMKFLADLIYDKKTLDKAESSFEEFWMGTMHEDDLEEIGVYIQELKR